MPRRALSRPRHQFPDRARRRAEAEGNLLHPRRRLCRRRAQARPDRADRRDHAGDRDRALRPYFRKNRLEHGRSRRPRRPADPGDRRARRARRQLKAVGDAHFADHAGHRDAAGLCRAGAAHRLSHRRHHGHRRRSAAQPCQVGDGGIEPGRRGGAAPKWPKLVYPFSTNADTRDRMTNNNEQNLPATAAKPAPGAVSRIRNYFLTGLIVAGPVAVTLWLIWWFVTWVDNLVRPFIPVAYRPETYLPIQVPGTGLIIAFVALTLLGFLTANLVGRKLVDLGERLLSRMPIVRPIYRTAKQIFQTLFSSSGSSFRRVGLVEFPSPGMWSLVFLTQSPSTEISARLPATEHVSAFMPCTPNPTTGFFFYVPRRDVIDLDITVEAAMQLLMSAGIIQPGGDDEQKRLATLAQTARAAQVARTPEPTAAK